MHSPNEVRSYYLDHFNMCSYMLVSEFFTKTGQSLVVKAEPRTVHFAGFTVGETLVKTLVGNCNVHFFLSIIRSRCFFQRLTNVSAKVQRWHVIPPKTTNFKVSFQKPERCVPGLFMDMKVIFTPDEWRYYTDNIRIHCQVVFSL